MYATIRHVTRFRYSDPVSEAVMEARMQPRTEAGQTCLEFELAVSPASRVHHYVDHLGNRVHHFYLPGHHTQLTLTADALVELRAAAALPQALGEGAWEELARSGIQEAGWEMALPSRLTRPSPALERLAGEILGEERSDPLTTLRRLVAGIRDRFEVTPPSPRPPAELEQVLADRRGGTRDLTHLVLALARRAGIPCRYMSGYVHRGAADEPSLESAIEAWAEAYLPALGWVGFDPATGEPTGERHIRVAAGRDGGDVPPTRGVYRGQVDSELTVQVRISLSETLPRRPVPAGAPRWPREAPASPRGSDQQ